MGLVSSRSNNASAQDLGDHVRRIAGRVDAMVRELIGGQALRVERTETGFVSKKRAARHGHAACKENFEGRIEPENGNAGGSKEFRAAGLRVGAAAECEDRAFFLLGSTAQGGAELVRLDLAERGLTQAFKNLRDGKARGFFDTVVEVYEAPGQLPSE